MNPRQRRAVLLLALAGAGLLGVFALVANYVSNVESEVGEKIVVLELIDEVAANQVVPESAVRQKIVPRKWAPEAALTDYGQLTGVVAVSNLQPGSILQEGMVATPPDLEEGEREIAILVDASTGVAGKVKPGDLVDVIASYGAQEPEQESEESRPNRALVVVPGARVINVGTPREESPNGLQDEAQAAAGEVVPVTFALSPRQTLKVQHAQTFGSDVRLALLRPGDSPDRTLDESIFRGEDPEAGKDGVR
jgi:pilus assembly protein CpaB